MPQNSPRSTWARCSLLIRFRETSKISRLSQRKTRNHWQMAVFRVWEPAKIRRPGGTPRDMKNSPPTLKSESFLSCKSSYHFLTPRLVSMVQMSSAWVSWLRSWGTRKPHRAAETSSVRKNSSRRIPRKCTTIWNPHSDMRSRSPWRSRKWCHQISTSSWTRSTVIRWSNRSSKQANRRRRRPAR